MKNLSDQPCLIARSLALVGDAWSMLIMRDAHAGLTRFDDFRRSLGIAPTMLTGRLSALTDDGLLVGYLETPDYQAALARMAETEVNSRWQEEMAPYFTELDGRPPDQGFRRIAEIFHLD